MALFHTTVVDNQIKALDTIGSASGSIATFDTDRAERLVKCVADIDDTSTQCVFTYAEKYIRVKDTNPQTYSQNGIDITTYSNGKITINGTATANTTIYIAVDEFTIFTENSRTIKFNNNFTGTTSVLFIYNSTVIDGWTLNTLNRQYTNFATLTGKTINVLAFNIPSGDTINNGSLMVEFIVTDTATVETISFGETVSGDATIDLITGILTRNDDTTKSLGGRDIPALSGYSYFCDTGNTEVNYIMTVGKAIS